MWTRALEERESYKPPSVAATSKVYSPTFSRSSGLNKNKNTFPVNLGEKIGFGHNKHNDSSSPCGHNGSSRIVNSKMPMALIIQRILDNRVDADIRIGSLHREDCGANRDVFRNRGKVLRVDKNWRIVVHILNMDGHVAGSSLDGQSLVLRHNEEVVLGSAFSIQGTRSESTRVEVDGKGVVRVSHGDAISHFAVAAQVGIDCGEGVNYSEVAVFRNP